MPAQADVIHDIFYSELHLYASYRTPFIGLNIKKKAPGGAFLIHIVWHYNLQRPPMHWNGT